MSKKIQVRLMRNKILVVDAHKEEVAEFEQIFQEIVERGGELFFAATREEGIEIMKKELPQLIFLDGALAGEKKGWVEKGVHIVVLRHKNDPLLENEEVLFKPLKRHRVLEKCHSVLNNEPAAPIPPM